MSSRLEWSLPAIDATDGVRSIVEYAIGELRAVHDSKKRLDLIVDMQQRLDLLQDVTIAEIVEKEHTDEELDPAEYDRAADPLFPDTFR